MSRAEREDTLMGVAYMYSQRSTCDRNKVGAVISVEGRIITTGYNGAPAGMPHCGHNTGMTFDQPPPFGELPVRQVEIGCKVAVHAEANAVAFAAKHGLSINRATVHTTLSPCYACAQLIINGGIVRVVFSRPYRDPSGVELLRSAGVVVDQMVI